MKPKLLRSGSKQTYTISPVCGQFVTKNAEYQANCIIVGCISSMGRHYMYHQPRIVQKLAHATAAGKSCLV